MSITCDCSVDYGEYPEFFREETPIARKVYKCCECGENIQPGQKYHKAIGKWDGDFQTYRTCWACHNIRMDYCSNGYVFGGLAEAISECCGFNYREKELDGKCQNQNV